MSHQRPSHLLAVTAPAATFASLVAAVAADGGRVGWLELRPPAAADPGLLEASAGGMSRAVAVGGGASQAVKSLRGPAVLRDVLREHFRGSRLVLIVGSHDLPALSLGPAGWLIKTPSGHSTEWSTQSLTLSLRRPSPGWLDPA